jgi:hypothetical protein
MAKSWYLFDAPAAKREANAQAQAILELQLAVGFENVPCPHCGKYQELMFTSVRFRHNRWLRILGAVAVVVGLLAFALWYLQSLTLSYTDEVQARLRLYLASGVTGCSLGILMCCLWAYLSWNYDPNNEAEQSYRLDLAQRRIIRETEATSDDGQRHSPQ